MHYKELPSAAISRRFRPWKRFWKFNTLHSYTEMCCNVLCCNILCCIVTCTIEAYFIILYCTKIQQSTVLHCTTGLCCSALLNCAVLHCTNALYGNALQDCVLLHCFSVLHSTILYCKALFHLQTYISFCTTTDMCWSEKLKEIEG